jgi:hypothetical protein
VSVRGLLGDGWWVGAVAVPDFAATTVDSGGVSACLRGRVSRLRGFVVDVEATPKALDALARRAAEHRSIAPGFVGRRSPHMRTGPAATCASGHRGVQPPTGRGEAEA